MTKPRWKFLVIALLPAILTACNLVNNPSGEQLSSGQPTGWHHSSWGQNTPVFSHPAGGAHSGSYSFKLSVTNYGSGDAEWTFDPLSLAPGNYRFSVWYKTDTIPHAVAHYQHADGTEAFFGLPDPLPQGTGWQFYSAVVPVPANAVKTDAYLFLSGNGILQTDDYGLESYSYVGWNRPLVTLTFDNGFEDNITNALPTLDQYGLKVSYCYSTEYVEGQSGQEAIVKQIAADGHETCSHAVHHADMTTESLATLDYELGHSRDYLHQLTGAPVTDFLTPFGAYNQTVLTEIAKYYQAHRPTDEGFNSKDGFDRYRLKVQNMAPTTTLAQFQSWINQAKASKTWLILVYHQIINPNGPNPVPLQDFDTYEPDFQAQMKWLSTAGVPVVPMDAALAEVMAQS